MTIETAYAASVVTFTGNINYPSGYTDKSGTGIGSATLEAWENQSGGSIGVNQFNDTSSDYAYCELTSKSSYEDSDWVLLYDYAANLSLTSGDTITDTSFALSRVQGNGTTSHYYLYDLVVQPWIYNGSDFTSGGQGSNLANTSTNWPQISGTSPTSGNFSTASYDFTTGPTYSNLTNSNWGVMVGVDGSQTSSLTGSQKSYAFLNSGQITATYTASSPPGQVTGLSALIDATNPTTAIDLSWSVPSGSPTSYTIQRASTLAGTFSNLATGVTGTTYVDSTCSPGTEYAYQVAGVNGSGTGTYSAAIATATEATGPTPSVGTVTTTSVALSWTAPSVGSTVSISSYNVGYRLSGSGSFSFVSSSTASYTMTGLSPGTSYDFVVETVIESNNGDWSGTIGGPGGTIVTQATLGWVPIPLGPAGFMGTGACPFGVTNQMRRNRMEGYFRKHTNSYCG